MWRSTARRFRVQYLEVVHEMRISSKPVVLLGLAASACASAIARRQDAKPELGRCPGYTASNVHDDGARVTADLSLAGPACNAYGEDLTTLKLEVEYQTGKPRYPSIPTHPKTHNADLCPCAQKPASTSRSTTLQSKSTRSLKACFPGPPAPLARLLTQRWRLPGRRPRSPSPSCGKVLMRRCSILRLQVWCLRASI